MVDAHPKLGQRYSVESYETPMFEADDVVPIGPDDFGNLRVDQHTDDRRKVLLWNIEEFRRAVRAGEILEVRPNGR